MKLRCTAPSFAALSAQALPRPPPLPVRLAASVLYHSPSLDSMAEPYASDGGGGAAAATAAALPYPPGRGSGSGRPAHPALDMGGGGDVFAGDDGRRAEPTPEAPWLQEGLVQLWPHISLIVEVRPRGQRHGRAGLAGREGEEEQSGRGGVGWHWRCWC